MISIHAQIKSLTLLDGYVHCFNCNGIKPKGRSCLCGMWWKLWEKRVGEILIQMSHCWIQSQYQHPEIKSTKTGDSLEVDFAGRGINLSPSLELPKFLLEVNELPNHFRTKFNDVRVFDMTIEYFMKIMFAWKHMIPLFFINIHDFVCQNNIKKKIITSVEERKIAERISDRMNRVRKFHLMTSEIKKERYFIDNFVRLPSPIIRLEPNCDFGHDAVVVDQCLKFISYVNENNLSEYIDGLWKDR